MVGLPLAAGTLPLRTHLNVTGVLRSAEERVVRAMTPGFVDQTLITAGQHVERGTTLSRLRSEHFDERLLEVE